VLRHRLVLSYDALSDGVTADDILRRVVDTLSADTARLAEPDTAA
jgi:hypothetical protein